MELNPRIREILEEFGIDIAEGSLCLLGIYFSLEVDKVCSEEVIKAINLTKIVHKDYDMRAITWNIPLFKNQEIGFSWVEGWLRPFGEMNPDRKGSWRDCASRMEKFFKKYPEYNRVDIYRARDAYLMSVKDPQYLMKSHKFIFDGIGALEKSELLAWCERVAGKDIGTNLKGKIVD